MKALGKLPLTHNGPKHGLDGGTPKNCVHLFNLSTHVRI